MVCSVTDPGWNAYDVYKDGFHDRLSRYWPEPREQLHAGGWRKTRQMVADIKQLMPASAGGITNVLDLCCGEGATASHLAATEGWRVTGVDIVESACKVARAKASGYGTTVRVKVETAADEAPLVHLKVSYDTVVRIKLSASEDGLAAVRLQLSYETVVRVKLTADDAVRGAHPAVALGLSYGAVVHAQISKAGANGKLVQLGLSYDPDVRVTLSPRAAAGVGSALPAVKLDLSYDSLVHGKLSAAGANGLAVKLGLSVVPGVRVKLLPAASAAAIALDLSYASLVHAHITKAGGDSDAVKLDLSCDPCVRVKFQPAISAAANSASAVKLRLSYQEVGDLVNIVHASIHDMPLPSNSYDVVYGQDPDGLANEHRIHAFREVLRVLRPGGLFYFWHHWIPGPGWPAELLQRYWSDPLTGSPRLSFECYLEDLQASGLRVAFCTDCTELALQHLASTAARMRAEAPNECGPGGSLPDKWLERTLQFAEEGGSMGIQVVAFKPAEA